MKPETSEMKVVILLDKANRLMVNGKPQLETIFETSKEICKVFEKTLEEQEKTLLNLHRMTDTINHTEAKFRVAVIESGDLDVVNTFRNYNKAVISVITLITEALKK